MKIFKTIFPVFVLLLIQIDLCATSLDVNYEKGMANAVMKLDSAKNVIELQQVRSQFERIALKYSKEWLPLYYVVYSDIQIVFYNPQLNTNEATLKNTKLLLQKLERLSNVDLSEINTLWAYYYNAIIILNPAVNCIV